MRLLGDTAVAQRWAAPSVLPGMPVSALAGHLARHGQIPFGQQIEIRQGEEIGRPSLLLARVEADGGQVTSVQVGGSAVIVARGELLA